MPNYSALFRAAVKESVQDYYALHREKMRSGFFEIRLHKRAPFVPARCYYTTCEPSTDNELDRWPLPYLAAEIAGEVADPLDVFCAPIRRLLVAKDGLTPEERYRYLVADMQHAKVWRPEEPIARPRKAIDLGKMKPIF